MLPGLGRIDEGALTVLADESAAAGRFELSGSKEGYVIVFTEGRTLVRWESCMQYVRLNGVDSPLDPFVLTGTGGLAAAANARYEPDSHRKTLAIRADVRHLGEVRIELDGGDYRLLRVTKAADESDSREVTLVFGKWGEAGDLERLRQDVEQRSDGDPASAVDASEGLRLTFWGC